MGDAKDSRHSPRDSVFRVAAVTLPELAAPLIGRVRDVSGCGARIECIEGLRPGMRIMIAIGAKPAVAAEIVWAAGDKCGVVFQQPQVPVQRSLVVCPEAAPTAGWIAGMRDRYRR